MKTIERILIKVIVVQFLFLMTSQIIFHRLNVFPELKELILYEGVSENNFSETLETIRSR